MKRKKQIEARMKACLANHRLELWENALTYDSTTEDIIDCLEIPQKIEDEGRHRDCPNGLIIPEFDAHLVARELAWVLGVDIDKKIDKFHEEIKKYLEKPKVVKAIAEWRAENV